MSVLTFPSFKEQTEYFDLIELKSNEFNKAYLSEILK